MLLASETSASPSRAPAPLQTRPPTHGGPNWPADLIIRQVQGIDSWNASRRTREEILLRSAGSREARGDAARDLHVWRRAHQALLDRSASELDRDPAPMLTPTRTAVLAHSQPGYADMIRGCLDGLGIHVLFCSDNGPDALGVLIVEQPSVLFVSDSLQMMTGQDLLREAARFCPETVLAACTVPSRAEATFSAGAHAVFMRSQTADAISWWLDSALAEPAVGAASEECVAGLGPDLEVTRQRAASTPSSGSSRAS